MRNVIITAPSLDPAQNVSGVSSVANFIIENNREVGYLHFQIGKTDKERGLWNRIKRIAETFKKWKAFLQEHQDALIHYSFPLSAPSILRDPMFMWHAIRNKRGMVVHVHGGLFLTAPHIPYILNRILKWVFAWDVPFIVLSEGEKETLINRFGAKRVFVLPNCPSLPDSLPQIPQINNDNRPLVLGYLGRIEPNKGMTELLVACKKLKGNGIKFLLKFAGKEETPDEYLPAYREALGDCFEYVGLVSGETKDAFLRSLDIFVMPTYFEGLPVSLLECMGYGVVPVVTPVGSIPDVVSNEEGDTNGVFVKVKDVDSIVDAICGLDKNRNLLNTISLNARQTITENFSPIKYKETLNKIYNEV